MNTEVPAKKHGDLLDQLGTAAAMLLTGYVPLRIHEWTGLSNPFCGAIGLLLVWTFVGVILGTGRSSKKVYYILLILTAMAFYAIGRIFHF